MPLNKKINKFDVPRMHFNWLAYWMYSECAENQQTWGLRKTWIESVKECLMKWNVKLAEK